MKARWNIFQSTSHYEAFGRSCLEANALGKPVIGSNTGGMLDLIDDGVTGFFFRSKDHRDFVRRVLTYAEDRRLVETHGENAIRRVDAQYSTERMADRYTSLYRALAPEAAA